MRVKPGWLLGTILLLPCASLRAQEVLYVKTQEAEIREGTGFSSPVLETVSQGTELGVRGLEGLRYRVVTPKGKEGYISKLKVTDERPRPVEGGLWGLVRTDRGPSEMGTASVGRGLTETAEEMARERNISEASVQAVRDMEQLAGRVSSSQVDSFLREGGLRQ